MLRLLQILEAVIMHPTLNQQNLRLPLFAIKAYASKKLYVEAILLLNIKLDAAGLVIEGKECRDVGEKVHKLGDKNTDRIIPYMREQIL